MVRSAETFRNNSENNKNLVAIDGLLQQSLHVLSQRDVTMKDIILILYKFE